jgi:hypothetical protein
MDTTSVTKTAIADWTGRYPWIVESALKNRQKHFVIDGEAVPGALIRSSQHILLSTTVAFSA